MGACGSEGKLKTIFVFEKDKLVTVILTKKAEIKHLLLSYDYLVEDPQEAEKQIAEWKQQP